MEQKKIYIHHEKFMNFLNVEDIDNLQIEIPAIDIAQQIADDLHPLKLTSSILISGYRGSGKSTVMKLVEKKLEKREKGNNLKTLVVNVNVPKYDGISTVLRKISRELHNSYEQHYNLQIKEQKLDIVNLEKELKKEINGLFIKTFNDVSNTTKKINKFEKSLELSANFNIKNLLELAFPIGTSLLLLANLTYPKYLNITMNSILLVLSSIWAASKIKATFKNKKTDEDNQEDVIKSLYDDEIAEFELVKIMENIHKNFNYNLVLILDEIDKIDKDDKIKEFISELKPLILSTSVNTVLITGQNLYYDYYLSNNKDDAIISTLFTKTYHIPLVPTDSLQKCFESTLVNKNDQQNQDVANYVKSKILESNRIPRRFFYLINQEIEQDDQGSFFLTIDEKNKSYLEWNAKLVDVLSEVEEDMIANEAHPKPIIDFIINQLFNWTKNISSHLTKTFTKEDISEHMEDDHPLKDYKVNEIYLNTLLDKLVYKRILVQENKDSKIEYKVLYDKELLEGFKGKTNSVKTNLEINFINQLELTQKKIREVYEDITGSKATEQSLNVIIETLRDRNIFTNSIQLDRWKILESLIGQDYENNPSKISSALDQQHHISTLIPLLIEAYTYHVLDKSFTPHGYTVLSYDKMRVSSKRVKTTYKPDIIIDKDNYLVYLEVRFFKKITKANISKIIDSVVNSFLSPSIEEKNFQRSLGILVFYEEDPLDNIPNFITLFNEKISSFASRDRNNIRMHFIQTVNSDELIRFTKQLISISRGEQV
ncbi:AAA family ATPase [Niallia circulans]|uniref:AAA family ATPase n=1 Tax=Niallia circulans TaxID=1397 RepID=UPI0026EACE39|nr:AAA family ATPase [Niallia circulans]